MKRRCIQDGCYLVIEYDYCKILQHSTVPCDINQLVCLKLLKWRMMMYLLDPNLCPTTVSIRKEDQINILILLCRKWYMAFFIVAGHLHEGVSKMPRDHTTVLDTTVGICNIYSVANVSCFKIQL